jgi:transcriptional regulator of aromatic amino acid metabolism
MVIVFKMVAPASVKQASLSAGEAQDGQLAGPLDALERRIITRTLKSAKSIRQAASHLGISHTAVRNKIMKHQP